jgi:hypothetical protein
MQILSRNLIAFFAFSSMVAGSVLSGDAAAADYIKHTYGLSSVEVTDPDWATERLGITDPIWDVVDWAGTDWIVVVPSQADLPREASIILCDEADRSSRPTGRASIDPQDEVTVAEAEVDSAWDLLEQIDEMMDADARTPSRRSPAYRDLSRSIDSGFITVVRSDALFDQAMSAISSSGRFSTDSVLVLNPDSMHPGSGWVSSNPTPHP